MPPRIPLEGGERGLAFASGMAAITTLALLFGPGDQLVASDDLYGGTHRLFEKVLGPLGISVSYADTSDAAAVEAALRAVHSRRLRRDPDQSDHEDQRHRGDSSARPPSWHPHRG